MTEPNNPNQELLNKLDLLLKKQDSLYSEINELKTDIEKLTMSKSKTDSNLLTSKPEDELPTSTYIDETIPNKVSKPSALSKLNTPKIKANLEKFIGENLISVIGVVILIIGVGIGVKYAIEHQMISPLTRIILGYLVGVGLMVFAIKLKAKYEYFSAVLLSGSLAIMYFLTYAAYDFYDLIPKMLAFGLMLVFTVFTTFASLQYNRQVIAHIGFVGAYAVPFLLSDGSGNATMLFTYMAIINVGILTVSIKKYWKSLYYSAFAFTWLIYITVYQSKLTPSEDLFTLLLFLTVYYLTFYGVFIGYKLLKKEKFQKLDIVLLMSNSFIFYGLGYSILVDHEIGAQLLGVFTLVNAIIHFGFSMYIHKQKLADRNLFYLVIGLVLTFITIAIPVQLNGHWVTLLWIGEAALLFWIGRTKQIPIYEKLSYPLMLLAFFSIMQDWSEVYNHYIVDYPETRILPIFNVYFLSSFLMICGFGFINYINHKIKLVEQVFKKNELNRIIQIALPAMLLLLAYFAISVEIKNYWHQLFMDSSVQVPYEDSEGFQLLRNYDYKTMSSLWMINYTMIFLTVLSYINIKKLKIKLLGQLNLGLNALTIYIFLASGLYLISELRVQYLDQDMSDYFTRGWFYIGIRYVSIGFVVALFYASYTYIKQEFLTTNLKLVFDSALYSTILWIASSELIHWMDFYDSSQSYKLGLSILWGVYALLLIAFGIWKNKKHIRLGAIGLFGITLFKLFFYDISHLNTIAKTIVFVILGILLLIISFLYNKFKHLIIDEVENKN